MITPWGVTRKALSIGIYLTLLPVALALDLLDPVKD